MSLAELEEAQREIEREIAGMEERGKEKETVGKRRKERGKREKEALGDGIRGVATGADIQRTGRRRLWNWLS